MGPSEKSEPPPALRSLAETLDANKRYKAYIETLLSPAVAAKETPHVAQPRAIEPDTLADLEKALERDPRDVEAVVRIRDILTDRKDWKALERAYRRMLTRLATAKATPGANADLERHLWRSLGLVYRDRLDELSCAVDAFKMVLHIDPLHADAYRDLTQIALAARDHERAWCMCSALVFLQQANDEEQRFYEEHRPRGLIQVKSRLDNEHWFKNLRHEDENIFIGKIFEMVTPAAIVAKTDMLAKAKRLPRLDKRFKHDPATSTLTFAKTFGWAAQVLGIHAPDLYVRNDVPGGLIAVPSRPPASVAGATVLTGFTPQELAFIVGKHLSSYRGEHYIKNLFPTIGELSVILFAALRIVQPDFAVPPQIAEPATTAAHELVKYMQPVERESLRVVVNKFIEDGAKVDLKRWMEAVDLTASRAGLLLCADLDVARRILAAEHAVPGDLSPSDRMTDLLAFGVSEEYLALRMALGAAIA